MSPIQTTILIVAVVTIVGVVISFMRKSSALAGYEELRNEVPKIASALRAEMFRDGEDLVIAGNYKRRPAQVRFSYAENTPGLNLRMQAPVSFTFSSVPKGARATEGRVLLRTGNDMFDAKFVSRTDHPTQAKMLVGGRASLQNIEKLCCSQKTYLTLTRGSIEVSELVIPAPYTSRHVLDHLESMSIVAATAEGIPGAESVKIVPYEREKSTPIFRLALIIAAIAAVLGVFFIRPGSPDAALSAAAGTAAPRAEGVDPIDAARIGDLKGWHAMRPEEYDPDAAGVLRGSGIDPNGHFRLDIDADSEPDDVYLLANEQGKSRIVILQSGKKLYDTLMSNVVGAMPVPQSSLGSIQWRIPPRRYSSSGDGILLLTRSQDSVQPLLMIYADKKIASGVPAQWQSISFR
jgi:hypothetical protein